MTILINVTTACVIINHTWSFTQRRWQITRDLWLRSLVSDGSQTRADKMNCWSQDSSSFSFINHDVLHDQTEFRDRSSTWPRNMLERSSSVSSDSGSSVQEETVSTTSNNLNTSSSEVPYGRRNPWGHHSYADLISMAISSSPDQRLTLNQIYDWLTNNIPYFAERRDAAASAGWKNSIRHNLSLHQKFQRIPNESSGKSSWWTVNQDPGSSGSPTKMRRRSTAGDTRTLQYKRDNVRARLQNKRWKTLFSLILFKIFLVP